MITPHLQHGVIVHVGLLPSGCFQSAADMRCCFCRKPTLVITHMRKVADTLLAIPFQLLQRWEVCALLPLYPALLTGAGSPMLHSAQQESFCGAIRQHTTAVVVLPLYSLPVDRGRQSHVAQCTAREGWWCYTTACTLLLCVAVHPDHDDPLLVDRGRQFHVAQYTAREGLWCYQGTVCTSCTAAVVCCTFPCCTQGPAGPCCTVTQAVV